VVAVVVVSVTVSPGHVPGASSLQKSRVSWSAQLHRQLHFISNTMALELHNPHVFGHFSRCSSCTAPSASEKHLAKSHTRGSSWAPQLAQRFGPEKTACGPCELEGLIILLWRLQCMLTGSSVNSSHRASTRQRAWHSAVLCTFTGEVPGKTDNLVNQVNRHLVELSDWCSNNVVTPGSEALGVLSQKWPSRTHQHPRPGATKASMPQSGSDSAAKRHAARCSESVADPRPSGKALLWPKEHAVASMTTHSRFWRLPSGMVALVHWCHCLSSLPLVTLAYRHKFT